MFPYYDHIVTAMVQCPFLEGNDISSFNIVNDIVVNLAVNMSTQIEAMF